jgi:hypothetical protein
MRLPYANDGTSSTRGATRQRWHRSRYGNVVVVATVDVVVGVLGFGNVAISAPLPVDISVSDPVAAPGVALLAPERLATQRLVPETAKADNKLK